MTQHQRKYYDVDISDIPFIEYTNIYVGNMAWINRGIHKSIATYDLVVREKPANWGFYIFDGLERYVDYLLRLRFDDDAIETLKMIGVIDSPETENFYRTFAFSGDIHALAEGTIFFPGEPIVRVTAPLAEANMITAFTMNAFGYVVRLTTKVARVKISAREKMIVAGATVRLAGFEQGIWIGTRAPYLLDSPMPQFTPQSYRKFPEIKPTGKLSANINHAFIKSFPTEPEAFRYVFDVLQTKADLFLVMIDTYGLRHGLEVFITEAKKSEFQQKQFMVTIDSGDILEESRYVRSRLDEVGFADVRIQVFSNLDEYKIKYLMDEKAPIDCFISSTEVANITDNPKFEAVYKMAELRHEDGTIEYKAKLAQGKGSLPGRKQIFRVFDQAGMMVEDIIGLETEQLGEPLLQKFVDNGKHAVSFENIDGVKARVKAQLASLPEPYKLTYEPPEYPVHTSEQLAGILEEVRQQHQ